MRSYLSDDPLLTTKEAAVYANISAAWFERERWKGTGPEYIRLSGSGGRHGAIRYRRSVLDAFFAANTVKPDGGR